MGVPMVVYVQVCSILRLLITWAQDCPPAVDALLMPAGRIPMLLDLTQHKCALASLLLPWRLIHRHIPSYVAETRVFDKGMFSPHPLSQASVTERTPLLPFLNSDDIADVNA